MTKAMAAAMIRRPWDELAAMVGGLGLAVPEPDDRLGRPSAVEGVLDSANDDQLDVLAGIVLPQQFNLDWEQRNPWEPGKFRLFLSHAHQDREFVGAVANALSENGIHG